MSRTKRSCAACRHWQDYLTLWPGKGLCTWWPRAAPFWLSVDGKITSPDDGKYCQCYKRRKEDVAS